MKPVNYLACLFFFAFTSGQEEKIDDKELKCLVCRRLVEEMEKDIDSIDPLKKVEVGTYRLDDKGNKKQKMVEYRRSEVYLTELMERICNRFDDYVRARRKETRQLVVVPLIIGQGKMNPELGALDIIQDADLNKSLKFYCEGLLEENEEAFVAKFGAAEDNLDIKLCSQAAQVCNQTLDEDYNYEDHDEL